jgi:hypothetical protein
MSCSKCEQLKKQFFYTREILSRLNDSKHTVELEASQLRAQLISAQEQIESMTQEVAALEIALGAEVDEVVTALVDDCI